MSLRQERKFPIAKPGWVSLRQAVFECFWKFRLKDGADRVQLDYESSFAPNAVEIDVTAQILRFIFLDGSIFEGAPWDLLTNDDLLHPNAIAGALMYNSVAAIWDMMKIDFNRKVSDGAVALFARADDFQAPFASVPPDHWSLYTVTNWENGTAVARDGHYLFSVHAETVARSSPRGRSPTFDQDQINGAVRRAIKARGFPDRTGDSGWQSRADVERLIRDYCRKLTGKEPARSTLQTQAKKALIRAIRAAARRASSPRLSHKRPYTLHRTALLWSNRAGVWGRGQRSST